MEIWTGFGLRRLARPTNRTPRQNIATEEAQFNPKGGRRTALLRGFSGLGRQRPLHVAAEQHKPNLTVGGVTEAAAPIGLIPKETTPG